MLVVIQNCIAKLLSSFQGTLRVKESFFGTECSTYPEPDINASSSGLGGSKYDFPVCKAGLF